MKKSCLKTILIPLLVLIIAAGALAGAAYYLITHRTLGEFFDSAGVKIHYTDEGEGEPVILVHGFAANADLNWRRPGVIRALKKDFRVIALDLRGHGLSGKPHDETKYGREMAEDVIHLMDHLKIKKAHVVGYSMGGFITLRIAVDHPDRLITAAACGSGWESPRHSRLVRVLPELEKSLRSGGGIGPLAEKLEGRRARPTFMHRFWVKTLTGMFSDSEALACVVHGLPEIMVSKQELSGIKMPVLSIAGGIDPLRASAEAMRGIVPDLTLVIVPGADHLRTPMRKKFRTALLDFLKKHGE